MPCGKRPRIWPRSRLSAQHAHGLTLVELLMVISIVAVLGAVAVPSFKYLRRDAERTAAVNSLLHAVFLARSTSIMRSDVIVLCKSRDGEQCAHDTAEWHDGWILFANLDREERPQRDPQEPVLLANGGWSGGTIRSNRIAYTFRPFRQTFVNGTIVFCDDRGSQHARALIISHTGRPRVSQRDASNRPLRCPG